MRTATLSKAHPSSDEAVVALAQPLGDAVVPGGAAQAPDVETLKRYLLLREQDVAALSAQLKAAREQVKQFEESLRTEKGRTLELTHVAEEQRRRIQDFEREKGIAVESVQSEVSELKFQIKARAERARALEIQIREATEETERTYLHRGIATRAFERRFALADHVRVAGAVHEHGMLHIDLVREVPEAMKPRRIEISRSAATPVLEAKAETVN